MSELSKIWPPFGLTLTAPRLELRPVRDEDIPSAVEAAASGIHDPGRSPFNTPWTEAPRAELGPNMARWYWKCRADLSPESWTLLFGVWHEGEFPGCQDVEAKDFPTLRTVGTGSWLKTSAQGHGFGKEMRAAVLLYSFDLLKADLARSEAADWNGQSLGVSRALGYEPNGTARQSWAGTRRDVHLLQVTPKSFKRPDWTLKVKGHEPLAKFLKI